MNKSMTTTEAMQKVEQIIAYRSALRAARANPSLSREEYKNAMLDLNAKFQLGTINAKTWTEEHDKLFTATQGDTFTFEEFLAANPSINDDNAEVTA